MESGGDWFIIRKEKEILTTIDIVAKSLELREFVTRSHVENLRELRRKKVTGTCPFWELASNLTNYDILLESRVSMHRFIEFGNCRLYCSTCRAFINSFSGADTAC